MLHQGDCLAILPTMDADSIDACVTDPPYHLAAITKRSSGGEDAAPPRVKSNMHDKVFVNPNAKQFVRLTKGFMGQQWDGGDIAFRPETWAAVLRVLKPGASLVAFGAPRNYHRMAVAVEDAGFEVRDCLMWLFGSGFPKSRALLKPAYEPIILARKPGPLRELDIDGCRVDAPEAPSEARFSANARSRHVGIFNGGEVSAAEPRATSTSQAGRWPANVLHDGSDEVLAGFPETKSGDLTRTNRAGYSGNESALGRLFSKDGDSGSASRFFYSAKASRAERAGSKHPTVKPLALMRWLCRLVTPPGGTVLDPFAGSGTTLQAAREEGFEAIGIEREPDYGADTARRLAQPWQLSMLFALEAAE